MQQLSKSATERAPRPSASQADWSVVERPFGRAADPELWRAWCALTRSSPPFLRPEFFALERPLLGEARAFVLAAYHAGELAGVLPLVHQGRTLASLRTDEICEFDYVGEPESLDAIWRALDEMGGWDTLELTGVPASSPLVHRLSEFALHDLSITAAYPAAHSPYFTLPGFEQRMPAKLRANVRRCARKLEDLKLERIATYSRAALEEGMRIEAMAWKGAAGTSMSSTPELRHFYLALTRLLARRGELGLYFLSERGHPFAFLYSVEDKRTVYGLRVGYDPAYLKVAPGHLLVHAVARDAEARGLLELNFMGHDQEWKRRWTDLHRDHLVTITYRPTVRGAAMLVGRELIKPRLSPGAMDRIRHTREEWARVGRHCQRNDLAGEHTRSQRIQARLNRGLGIRSGFLRLVGKPRPMRGMLGAPSRYEPGEWVRVRDAEAVRATLDAGGKLRGLPFMDYQYATCGQVFRVQGPCRRLVDDDGQIRRVAHTVLLEGVTCDAGLGLGCGRHCPMMYRDEWLEPAEAPESLPPPAPPEGWATVRPLVEIEAGLDARGRHDGLTFLPEMARYAGQRLPIARQLTKLHELGRDTRARAPIYQLDGAICTGLVLGEDGPCHRACPMLWHGDWLTVDELVENGDG